MSSEVALSLHHVSKSYRIFAKPQDRLKQMFLRGKKRYFTEFWALRDISFEVPRGSSIGIVGRNGAGKSTLLQIISGILTPSSGSVTVNGRVAALLELGTGFNPDFTGRENVFINGAILGLSRDEISLRYDDIVSFADIGNFIDQPVKTYSSGMLVRLAFAVAIHVDPDILIIDEALSVGDAKFQSKCFRKFQDFREKGKTILFVTHATEQMIRHCDHAVLIENGRVYAQGEPKSVANTYLNLLFGITPIEKEEDKDAVKEQSSPEVSGRNSQMPIVSTASAARASAGGFLEEFIRLPVEGDNSTIRPGYNKAEFRWGSKEAEIIDYMLCSDSHWHVNHFHATDKISLYAKVRFHKDVEQPIYGLTVKTPDGITVYGTNSRDWDGKGAFVSQKAGETVVVHFALVPHLISGHYILSLGVAEQGLEDVLPLDRRYDIIEIYLTNLNKSFGLADLEMTIDMVA